MTENTNNSETVPRAKDTRWVIQYKNNYRTQIEAVNLFSSYVLEFLHKSNIDPVLTKKMLDELGNLRACLFARGRENRDLYFGAAAQVDKLGRALSGEKAKSLERRAKELIKRTNHLARTKANGYELPEDPEKGSAVDGALKALDLILQGHPEAQRQQKMSARI